MHLGHTALVAGPQLANEGDDVQAELAVRQRPGSRFFRDHGPRILRAGRVHTLPDPNRQAPEPVEAHDRTVVVIGYPQALLTRTALFAQRTERLLVGGG